MFGRRRGVRMSLLVSADAKSAPGAVHVLGPGTRLLNKIFGAMVRFQHLPVPFELYSDGIDLPVFEEFGAGTAALHLADQLERNELLADTEYRRRFRTSFDRTQARTHAVAPRLPRRHHRRMPRRDADRQELRTDRRRARPASARRVPRRARRERRAQRPLDDHRRQPPAQAPRQARRRAVHPHGLLRCRCAPAQHGLLQLRAAAAQAGPRRRPRRSTRS